MNYRRYTKVVPLTIAMTNALQFVPIDHRSRMILMYLCERKSFDILSGKGLVRFGLAAGGLVFESTEVFYVFYSNS